MSRRISVAPATSLRTAFEQDKRTAIIEHRRGIERIAELMNNVKPATLYDWIDEVRMPVHALPAWEHATGGSSVMRYLSSQGGRLLIDIPRGRALVTCDVQGLQRVTHEAIGTLLKFSEGEATADDAMAALLHAMGALAWHRENVRRASQPELELGEAQ
ncbi:hypothetical protein [Rhodocyclus tenuis]|uniref:Uncharacterized protein n=1 Tax=Rhodocyclus tenuis TaxID=1066 RepID=A0A840GCI6_RHOTE|nr:hypothetical protein [Rhodocyclus tenuis]MBB4248358.1 hypothetical protein [Rhodocyclus tenuis]